MGRRFILVGLLVIFPFQQGSIMQLAMANLVAIVFFCLQLQVNPYLSSFDDYLALGCSLSLSVMLLCAIVYKYAGFTDLPDIYARMSHEQRSDFEVAGVLLSSIFIICVFGTFALSALLLSIQLAADRQQRLYDARVSKARRLRAHDTGDEVQPVLISADQFHLFLSQHVAETRSCAGPSLALPQPPI